MEMRQSELHQYDSLGRLTSSHYSSSVSGTTGRFDESVSYNPNGSITSLLRGGMKNNGTFGVIDDLTVTYDGNHLLKVTDDAEALNYNGALDFHDGDDANCEYQYDSDGALTYDSNRGIASVIYDYSHHPYMIYISDGRSYTKNYYTPDGRKLSSLHVAYIANGNSFNRVLSRDTYIDGLILRGDTTLLWRFDGGYVSLNANGTPTCWNYYITDHLGSTRMVVDNNDTIKETISYYPFGSEMKMENPALLNSNSWQRFRFTGKELDRQNGLNMYDFGARWYDVAGVPMWTSVDPLCEKYYSISPYAYCAGNPVNGIDPNGMEPIYDTTGIFLGNTKEGFTGHIYIYNGFGNIDFSEYTMQDLLKSDESYYLKKYEDVATSYTGKARENFVSNVMTNIVTNFNGIKVYGTRFDINALYNNKIEYEEKEGSNFTETPKNGKISIKANQPTPCGYEATVENLAASMIIHEWYGHGVRKYGDHFKFLGILPCPNHHKVYELVKGYDRFYKNSTNNYKSFVNSNWKKYYNKER